MKKIFKKGFVKKDVFWVVMILFVSLLAIYPLFRHGFYSFHDEPHLANLYEMTRAFSSGQFPPRWAPDFAYNYGYPLFNFYYLLPYYLGSFFYFVFNLSLIWSLKLVFALSVPLSGLAFYFLMKKFFGQAVSFAGAALYLFTPYRALDIYVRGSVGEMWGFVFMPLVLLTLTNLIRIRNFNNFVLVSFSLAGLVISHNLTAMIFLPLAFLFSLLLIFQEKKRLSSFLWTAFGYILGLGLSAYYWLPAFLEKRYTQPGTPFNPFDHFPFIKQLIIPFWGYGASVWGIGDGLSFQIGVVNILVVLMIFVGFVAKRGRIDNQKKPLLYFFAFLFVFFVFLMNIRSGFLWRIFSLGDYLQFPWRFLLLATLLSSFLFGFVEEIFPKKKSEYLAFILALLAVVFTFSYFKPQNQILVNDDYYLNRFFANINSKRKTESVSKDYPNFSEDYLPLTIWTEKRPDFVPKEKIEALNGSLTYKEESLVRYKAEITSSEDTSILFHNYYFPGWKAKIDGEIVPVKISKPHGDMFISVPAGYHQVIFWFANTPVRLTADIISLFSLTLLTLFLIFGQKNIFKQ